MTMGGRILLALRCGWRRWLVFAEPLFCGGFSGERHVADDPFASWHPAREQVLAATKTLLGMCHRARISSCGHSELRLGVVEAV
ncbi:hypothetical protein BS17DRAFT_781351 [Gyrodon lividus]|nr:hypothetical protein BS17DRAFT_781351 [Gyrodon lividus]